MHKIYKLMKLPKFLIITSEMICISLNLNDKNRKLQKDNAAMRFRIVQ